MIVNKQKRVVAVLIVLFFGVLALTGGTLLLGRGQIAVAAEVSEESGLLDEICCARPFPDCDCIPKWELGGQCPSGSIEGACSECQPQCRPTP